MEEEIKFVSEENEIEGLFESKEGPCGAVITHPHPLYGGDMYNSVVEVLAAVYREKGFSTLRFNFRGTGGSSGFFDHGRGERQDVRAALSYLKAAGCKTIDLAGYSFGAWVNAHLKNDDAGFDNMIMVSPPVAFMGFEAVDSIPALKLVVTGSRDDIAPPGPVQKALPSWSQAARFEIVEGADHFYSGRLEQLEALLRSCL